MYDLIAIQDVLETDFDMATVGDIQPLGFFIKVGKVCIVKW